VLPAVVAVLGWVPIVDPVADEPPVVEPPDVAAVPVVVAALVCVAVAVGKLTASYGFARLVPATPELWAAAGSARTTENSNAM